MQKNAKSIEDAQSQEAHRAACKTLIESKRTLLLSTVSEQGIPEISYAPYLREDGVFYIFVSELATHTQNLMFSVDCSVLFIADEQISRNMFARERVSFCCRAEEVDEGDEYEEMLDRMEQLHGQTVAMLRSLPDFHLFALKPVSGTYVVGFGKAFGVDPADFSLRHITPGSKRCEADG